MLSFLLEFGPGCFLRHFREVIPSFRVKSRGLVFLEEEVSREQQPLDFGQGVLMEAALSFGIPEDYTPGSMLNHLWGEIPLWACREQRQQHGEALPGLSWPLDGAQHASAGRLVVMKGAEEPRGVGTGCTWNCSSPGTSKISPRALSCAVVLLLLLTVLSRGKRCSIARILRQYRAVIFHEIHNLKTLSGSVDRSGRAGPACRSDKDQKILFSIYNITMALWEAAAGSVRGPEELALWKVARTTDVVFRESCRSIRKSPPRIPAQPRGRGRSHRRKMLREVGRKAQRLVTCWEKLYALHAPQRAPRDS